MEQCLRVLEKIQPATREQWAEAHHKDQQPRYAYVAENQVGQDITDCIDNGLAVFANSEDLACAHPSFRLAYDLDKVLIRVDEIYARNAILNAVDPKIVELLVNTSATHREFCVTGVSTRDVALAAVAGRIHQGDAHPWYAGLKAQRPCCVRTVKPGEHVVSVLYTKGSP